MGFRNLEPRHRALLETWLPAAPSPLLLEGTIARWLCWACRASAITLGRVIVLSPAAVKLLTTWNVAGQRLLLHELVHVCQYHHQGRARFLLRYFGEYLAGRWRGLAHHQAYLAIGAEAAAREAEATFCASLPGVNRDRTDEVDVRRRLLPPPA